MKQKVNPSEIPTAKPLIFFFSHTYRGRRTEQAETDFVLYENIHLVKLASN